MSDLIDRKMVIDEICRVCLVCCAETCQGRNPDSKWCEEITALREIPSAKPRQGEWTKITIPWSPDYLIYKCSECGGIEAFRSRFCPHCGAEMRGAGYESFYE